MGYSALFLDHFDHPRNAGGFAEDDPAVGSGLARVQIGGDDCVRLQIRVENGIIVAARFMALGAAATIAGGSWVSEWLRGKTLSEAARIHDGDISAALELPPARLHCAVLVMDAVKAAIANYTARHYQDSSA